MSVVVHWDVENQKVPAGSSVASVCNRIRAALLERFDYISGLYAYMDVTREKDKIRTQLAMMGYDIIDCSSAKGKTGQVDMRIVVRALSQAVPIVCLISGDGDFACMMSTLRNMRTQTVLIYNSDTRSTVNTTLIEATDVPIGLQFSGDSSETSDANGKATADAASQTDEAPSAAPTAAPIAAPTAAAPSTATPPATLIADITAGLAAQQQTVCEFIQAGRSLTDVIHLLVGCVAKLSSSCCAGQTSRHAPSSHAIEQSRAQSSERDCRRMSSVMSRDDCTAIEPYEPILYTEYSR